MKPKMVLFGVLTVIAAGVCVRLGFWQLDRLEQRRAKNALVLERGTLPPLPMRALREQRVCVFTPEESDVLVRPGPRVAEGARLLARCIAQKGMR